MSDRRPNTAPIILADPSRERRLFLQHALDSVGYTSLCTASGVDALRLVSEYGALLLVAHLAIRCSEPIAHALDSECAVAGTRTLWFSERSTPQPRTSSQHDATIVECGENPAAVVCAVQRLLDGRRGFRRKPRDFLLMLMLLEAELADVPGQSSW